MEKKLFDILKERGYVKDLTHEQEIIDLVNGEPMTFYLGIDPTADSLHIGHFFALTMFRWLQDFGHHGIILIGGATALIGDPTGKSNMRKMLSKEEVAHNKAEVKELVKRFVRTDGDNPAIIVDNADWICDKTYVDFMRDIGVHFNVNTMLSADCYKKRIENGGLTFLEMGYMLMQAFDFVHLNKEFDCKLQIGGSDQWGNILAGANLSRKIGFSEGKKIDPLFGLTCPLLIKADGEKMGKTATGTLWVSRDKTTPFDFFQAWINSLLIKSFLFNILLVFDSFFLLILIPFCSINLLPSDFEDTSFTFTRKSTKLIFKFFELNLIIGILSDIPLLLNNSSDVFLALIASCSP